MGEHNSLQAVAQDRDIEVDEQADSKLLQLQVADELCAVNRVQLFARFQLDDHFPLDD